MEKPKVSILCVIKDEANRFCFESNVFSRIKEIESDQNKQVFCGISIDGISIEILIADIGSGIKQYKNCSSILSKSIEDINVLLQKAKGEFICVTDPNTLLREGWLNELMFYSENIQSSGVVAIASEISNVEFTALLTKNDELTNVFVPVNNSVVGTSLFRSDYIPYLGALNTNFRPYEICDYSIRIFYAVKRINFYIPSQLALNITKSATCPSNAAVAIITDLVSRNDYYLQFK